MNNNIKKIQEEKKAQEEKIKDIKKELFFKNFFKTDLLIKEKNKLDLIISEYNSKKNELEAKLKKENSKELIKQLLENEKDIYKKLLPFIKKEKYDEYKEYIKQNIELLNKKITLDNDQKEQKEILNKKLNLIKQKILIHNQVIKRKIEKVVRIKIQDKLTNFMNKDKFQKLSTENKLKVFDLLIKKLNEKIPENPDINDKKTQIYLIIIKELKKIQAEIKNQEL